MATIREIRTKSPGWHPEVVEVRDTSGLKAAQVIYYVAGVVETVLLFRFAFKLFAANSANTFVSFINDLTAPLIAPFQGIFATPREGVAVFESATVIAMIVYAVIAYIIARLFFVATEGTEETEEAL